ncbi:MAG: hypothetical protein ACFFCV_07055 [Promethearchaeota archaeon]
MQDLSNLGLNTTKYLKIVMQKENQRQVKNDKLTIRILPEELKLYRLFVLKSEYKNVSELVRDAVREKILRDFKPNPTHHPFEHYSSLLEDELTANFENEIEKLTENVNLKKIDKDILIDVLQKQLLNDIIAISILRRKIEENE